MRSPRYQILRDQPGEPLRIQDLGPWEIYPSVTNGAETVVQTLWLEGRLPPGRRLFYIDSDGNEDEILVKDGVFAGFKAGTRGDG